MRKKSPYYDNVKCLARETNENGTYLRSAREGVVVSAFPTSYRIGFPICYIKPIFGGSSLSLLFLLVSLCCVCGSCLIMAVANLTIEVTG